MAMILETIAAFQACRTPRDFKRCQLSVERQAGPLEFAALHERAALLPEAAQNWIADVWRLMFHENQRLQEFRRQPMGTYLTLFSGTRAAIPAKQLVVAFPGHQGRLGLPNCATLQYFADDRYDVMMPDVPLHSFFMNGVPGYANTLPALLDRLTVDLRLGRYSGVRTVGNSGGGAAAIRAAVALNATRGVAVDPVLPIEKTGGAPVTAETVAEMLTPWSGVDPQRTKLIAACAAAHPRDRAHSEYLARGGMVEVLIYEGMDDHNLLFAFLRQGRLRRFMDEVVLG
jgi:hypothetical protein